MSPAELQASSAVLKESMTAASSAWSPLIAIGPSWKSRASHHASGVAWPTAAGGAAGAPARASKAMEELEDEGWTIFSPSNIDFDAGSKSHLEESLRNLRLALMQARLNQITSRSLVEECHSTVEHVMDALLTRTQRRSLSYSEKVDALVALGLFDGVSNEDHVFGNIPGELKELKDYRREAKHRGRAVDHKTALRLATAVVVAVNFLLAIIRKQDRERVHGA